LENNILTKLWILNLADGNNSVEEMASRSEIDLEEIILNAKILEKEGLIKFKRRN